MEHLIKKTLRRIVDKVLIILARITKTDLVILSYKQKGVLNSLDDSGEEYVLGQIIKDKVNSNFIFFDVGANVGKYSKSILGKYPEAFIYAFEPHPVNFKKLSEEFANENKVKIYNIGFGPKNCETKIFDRSDKDGSQHASLLKDVIKEVHKQGIASHNIKLENMQDFCKNNNIQKINFLKLDTEGTEFEILNSSKEIINSIDFIQFEFNEMNIFSRVFFRDFYNLLNKDFDIFKMHPNKIEKIKKYDTKLEIFKFQNFLAINKKYGEN